KKYGPLCSMSKKTRLKAAVSGKSSSGCCYAGSGSSGSGSVSVSVSTSIPIPTPIPISIKLRKKSQKELHICRFPRLEKFTGNCWFKGGTAIPISAQKLRVTQIVGFYEAITVDKRKKSADI
ncbi:MAG: hypothetical protein ACLFUY_03015, partial [Desulfobacterales bacterium]